MPSPAPKEDYYSFSSWWFWILAISINVYLLCVILYHVLIANNTVFHSYVEDLPAGHWVDYRFNDIEWFVQFAASFKIFMFLAVNFAIKSRRSKGCYTVWTALVSAITFLQMLAVFGLLSILSNCNASGNRHSICNDKLFCCAPSINANPVNHCTNLIPCPFIITQTIAFTEANLSPNEDFKWLLATNVFFFLFDVGYTMFFILSYKDVPNVDVETDEGEKTDKEESYYNVDVSKRIPSKRGRPSLIKKE